MDTWELWVRERDTLRLHFKAKGYTRKQAQEEANEWESEGYKVKIYAGNTFAQAIINNEELKR